MRLTSKRAEAFNEGKRKAADGVEIAANHEERSHQIADKFNSVYLPYLFITLSARLLNEGLVAAVWRFAVMPFRHVGFRQKANRGKTSAQRTQILKRNVFFITDEHGL